MNRVVGRKSSRVYNRSIFKRLSILTSSILGSDEIRPFSEFPFRGRRCSFSDVLVGVNVQRWFPIRIQILDIEPEGRSYSQRPIRQLDGSYRGYPCPLAALQSDLAVFKSTVIQRRQDPSTNGEHPSTVSQMLFMSYATEALKATVAIVAVCAFAGLALLSVWLPVYFGLSGFPVSVLIWLGTAAAAVHALHWAFG
jgi:hypothetical protein